MEWTGATLPTCKFKSLSNPSAEYRNLLVDRTACMGIALAGYRFNKREEQEAIYDFFIYTAEEYAWDTTLM